MVGGRDIQAQHSLRTFDLVQSKSQVSLNCSHTNCQVWEEGVTLNEFTNYKIQILFSNDTCVFLTSGTVQFLSFLKRTSDSIALNFDANGDMGWIKRWHWLDKQRAGQYLQPVNQGQRVQRQNIHRPEKGTHHYFVTRSSFIHSIKDFPPFRFMCQHGTAELRIHQPTMFYELFQLHWYVFWWMW